MRIFSQLIGTWVLQRKIFDRFGDSQFVGECSFVKTSDTQILCEEKGVLTYNGYQSEASRQYIYELQGSKIVILYNDSHRSGDPLHELNFVAKDDNYVAHHCHQCGQDMYDLKFEISSHGHILMDYVVKGPHKDYKMESRLTKIIPFDQ
jgi:Family of unknown function (DUF6314)